MTTVYTRAAKGSALTWTEGDANITNLNTDKIEAVVDDTTPQLGGNLDVNGNSIVSASNGDISITPNGTGSVIIDGNEFPQTQGAAGEVLTADGSGLVEWKTPLTLSAQVYNADSVTINKGQPVYVFSSTGTNISVKLALNTGDATSAQTLGLAAETITAGSTGNVICQGLLKNVDTSSYTAGQALYLGSTAGTITTTKPYAPNHLVYLGFVETVNAVSGRIYVRTQNGYELDEIHDVNINHNVAIANNQYLKYNSSNSLWENSDLDISHDTTPTLGGNLDVLNNTISNSNALGVRIDVSGDYLRLGGGLITTTDSSTDLNLSSNVGAGGSINISAAVNGNIEMIPNGTGDIILTADTVRVGDTNTAATITTNGTGSLTLSTNNGTNSGSILITQGANANITVAPNGTGDVILSADTVVVGDNGAAATITSNGAGNLVLNTNSGTNSGTITIAQGANGAITIAPNGTGDVILTTDTVNINESTVTITTSDSTNSNLSLIAPDSTNSGSAEINIKSGDSLSSYTQIELFSAGNATYGQRSMGTVFGGSSSSGLDLYGYIDTTGVTTGGAIQLPGTANSNISITPNGTGDVYLNADTVRVGDSNTAATLTTNGTGSLTINTNAGTNSGSIAITAGANGAITISPNGSGSVILTGPSIATATATTAGVAGLTARNAPSPGASGSIRYPSLIAQKHRTDIALASMTNEPAVIAYAVRDSSSVNRIFGTHRCVYQGTGTNPYFAFDMSTDGFTTTVNAVNFGGGQANWGNGSSNYTHSTIGTGSLILNTNQGTTTGNITLVSGANQNITITPNGTGLTKITNLQYNEAVYAIGNSGASTLTPDAANGNVQTITATGNFTLSAFSNPVSGQTITFIITQDATGSRTLTSTMKFAGASKTLSTAANAIDILTVSYIGTTYYATLSKGYA